MMADKNKDKLISNTKIVISLTNQRLIIAPNPTKVKTERITNTIT